MIGLMVAMEEEVNQFKAYSSVENTREYAGMNFYSGVIQETDIVIVRCGIGKVNAAVSAQIMIDRYDIEGVVLAGLAESLVPYLQNGDIVLANQLIQFDGELAAFAGHVGELPDIDRIVKADPEMLKQMTRIYNDVFAGRSDRPQMLVGTIVSSDSVISDRKTISWLQREFGAVAAETEGAAVAQVCRLNRCPFLVIRTICDDLISWTTEEFSTALETAPIKTLSMIKDFMANRQSEVVSESQKNLVTAV